MAGWLPLFSNTLTFPATFLGNPNVTITAINTSGGIVTSRDSDGSTYQTPFFIQASASAITATGTSAPYEDLEYQWNFGDASSTETFTRPTDGATVNSNADQKSPEAVHCYRSAGTYTIRLTIRGKNGGGYTTASVTKQIVVNAFATGANEMWFDEVGGSDSNNGLSSGAPKQTIGTVNTALLTSGAKVWLKKGSHWTGATGMKFSDLFADIVGVRVDAYGSGANPIIEVSSGSAHACQLNTGGASSTTSKLDIVISNCYFLNSGSTGAAMSIGVTDSSGTHLAKNLYFDNCTFETSSDSQYSGVVPVITAALGHAADDLAYNWGWWKSDVLNPTNTTKITQGIGGSAKYWLFHVGGTVRGAGEDPAGDHHLYNDCKTHSHYRWIDFGQTGTGTNRRCFCINGNWDETEVFVLGHGDATYHCYSENSFQYTLNGFDLGNRTNNTNALDSTDSFISVVVDGNAFVGVTGSLFACGLSVTQRDNRQWGGIAQFHGPYDGAQVSGYEQKLHLVDRIYRNKFHIPSGATTSAVVVKTASGWTSPMTFTDNIIADFRSVGVGAFQMYFADQASAGSLIDRNTIYTPNNLSQMATDQTAGARTYAQYKALAGSPDVNGVNTSATVLAWPTTATQWSDLN